MPDKTANWGVPGSGARYRTQDSDPTGGGNFVVAERLDSNGDPVDVLLEWDETAGEWVSGGPVNLDGEDVTNVGALDANSVSTGGGSINETFVADPDASDIGAEINRLQDNECSTGDAIFIPPGEYHNQNTRIDITKDITLFSTGGWRNPGARLFKQSDIEQLRTLSGGDSSGGAIDESIDIIGLLFSGADVSDASNGVRLRGAGTVSIASHEHGQDGVYITTEDFGEGGANLNGAELKIVANQNGRDGVRTENGSSGINMNAMDVEIHANENTGTGVNNIDGYAWRAWLWTQSNGGKGFDLNGINHSGVAYTEANGTDSTATGGGTHLFTGTQNDFDETSPGVNQMTFSGQQILGNRVVIRNPDGTGEVNVSNQNTTGAIKTTDFNSQIEVEDDNGDLRPIMFFPQGDAVADPAINGDGAGLVVTTPDGTAQYRIRVDNSGNIVTDQV